MENDDKIQAFLELMVINRKNITELVKTYLINYNPAPEMLEQLKAIMEDQNIFLENDCSDFMDKFKEYKKTLKESIEVQMRESMNNNFESIMAKNFPGAK